MPPSAQSMRSAQSVYSPTITAMDRVKGINRRPIPPPVHIPTPPPTPPSNSTTLNGIPPPPPSPMIHQTMQSMQSITSMKGSAQLAAQTSLHTALKRVPTPPPKLPQPPLNPPPTPARTSSPVFLSNQPLNKPISQPITRSENQHCSQWGTTTASKATVKRAPTPPPTPSSNPSNQPNYSPMPSIMTMSPTTPSTTVPPPIHAMKRVPTPPPLPPPLPPTAPLPTPPSMPPSNVQMGFAPIAKNVPAPPPLPPPVFSTSGRISGAHNSINGSSIENGGGKNDGENPTNIAINPMEENRRMGPTGQSGGYNDDGYGNGYNWGYGERYNADYGQSYNQTHGNDGNGGHKSGYNNGYNNQNCNQGQSNIHFSTGGYNANVYNNNGSSNNQSNSLHYSGKNISSNNNYNGKTVIGKNDINNGSSSTHSYNGDNTRNSSDNNGSSSRSSTPKMFNTLMDPRNNPKSPDNYSSNLNFFLNPSQVANVVSKPAMASTSTTDGSNIASNATKAAPNNTSTAANTEEIQASSENSPTASQPSTQKHQSHHERHAGEKVLHSIFSPQFQRCERGEKIFNSSLSASNGGNSGCEALLDVTFEGPSSCENSVVGVNSTVNSGRSSCVGGSSGRKIIRQVCNDHENRDGDGNVILDFGVISEDGDKANTRTYSTSTTPKSRHSKVSDVSTDEFFTPNSTISASTFNKAHTPVNNRTPAKNAFHFDNTSPSSSAAELSDASTSEASSHSSYNNNNSAHVSYNSLNTTHSSKNYLLTSFRSGGTSYGPLPPVWEEEEMKCQRNQFFEGTKNGGKENSPFEEVFVCCDPFQNVLHTPQNKQSKNALPNTSRGAPAAIQEASFNLLSPISSTMCPNVSTHSISTHSIGSMTSITSVSPHRSNPSSKPPVEPETAKEPREEKDPIMEPLDSLDPLTDDATDSMIMTRALTVLSSSRSADRVVRAKSCSSGAQSIAQSGALHGKENRKEEGPRRLAPTATTSRRTSSEPRMPTVHLSLQEPKPSKTEACTGQSVQNSQQNESLDLSFSALSSDLLTSSIINAPSSSPAVPKSVNSNLSSTFSSKIQLPQNALTVDFVKNCESVEVLHAILDVLSDNNDKYDALTNAMHGASGKQSGTSTQRALKYPRLGKFVEKRLESVMSKLQGACPKASVTTHSTSTNRANHAAEREEYPEIHQPDRWAGHQLRSDAKGKAQYGIQLPPRIATTSSGSSGRNEKREEWREGNKENVEPNAEPNDKSMVEPMPMPVHPKDRLKANFHSSISAVYTPSTVSKELLLPASKHDQHPPLLNSTITSVFAESSPTFGPEQGTPEINSNSIPSAIPSRPSGVSAASGLSTTLTTPTTLASPATLTSPTSPYRPLSPAHDTHDTLNMDLSESLFTLDDETAYWKQGFPDSNCDDGMGDSFKEKINIMIDTWAHNSKKCLSSGGKGDRDCGVQHPQHSDRQLEVVDAKEVGQLHETALVPQPSQQTYTELEEKLASALESQAQLTKEVDSLIKEHNAIQAQLNSKLNEAESNLAAEKERHSNQMSLLERDNTKLSEEVQTLQESLHANEMKALEAQQIMQLQLEETRHIHLQLLADKEALGRELKEARLAYDKAHVEVVRLKGKEYVDAAKSANKALAKALALSEKDLAQAQRRKEELSSECTSIREKSESLEDKAAYLSTKIREMSKELKSSHAYIDKLYGDLESRQADSNRIKEVLERKKSDWMKMEEQYRNKIQELEDTLKSQHTRSHKETHMLIRQYKHDLQSKQDHIDQLQASLAKYQEHCNSSIQKGFKQRQMTPRNDENAAPGKPEDYGGVSLDGKQLRRIDAVKAAGGRKGLTEKFKNVRRFGDKVYSIHNETNGDNSFRDF